MLWRFIKKIFGLFSTVLVLAASLFPLSALLLAYPAFVPQESIYADAVKAKRNFFARLFSRGWALMLGLVVFLGLLAVSIELVTRMPLPEEGAFALIPKFHFGSPQGFLGATEALQKEALQKMTPESRAFFTTPLWMKLPPALIEHWPIVIVVLYLLDILLLLFIGRVPLSYNLRNVAVRWKTNALTAVAFTFVIGLLAVLLAFVNGMNNLTKNSGVPGNVFVLSDGSTDEVFSNLGYGDLSNVERVEANLRQVMNAQNKPLLLSDDDDFDLGMSSKDTADKEIWKPIKPVRVKQFEREGKKYFMASRETFYSINSLIPNTSPERRRLVQLRTNEDPYVAAEVHNIDLQPGGRWFNESGMDANNRIECVLGANLAGTLGVDYGKKTLVAGDEFDLAERKWVVTGVMTGGATTYGSEMWAKRFSVIYGPFGKQNYTSLVMRVEPDNIESARIFANFLNKKYSQQKLNAYSEPDYYAEISKTNSTFLIFTVVICIVMAIGGVFGMMTTMFASIAQRIKDIGVLRLLGFKRWQVMTSFLLESLTIALLGGLLGVIVAYLLADGRSSVSTLSTGGGGPGGKSVTLTLNVDIQVMAMGLLFALGMGRLGGLVPALGATRMKILDSLR